MAEPEEGETPDSTRKADKTAEKKSNGRNGNGIPAAYKTFDDAIRKVAEEGKRVSIHSHRFPDPDAIGSMLGMQWLLLRKFNVECDLFYYGEVAHPQNATLCNHLEPGLRRIEDFDSAEYGFHILVDTIPKNAGVNGHKIEFDVVIDHHRDLPQEFDGILIHLKSGSCSAIVFDMIKKICGNSEPEVWFEHGVDFDMKVATAMITGIMVDTTFMLSDDTTEYERHAFDQLFPFRESKVLHDIVFFKRPKFWIDKKAQGASSAMIDQQGYAIVGLGMIPEKQRDLLADMADEMVSWASVETAIAFGVVGGDRIEGCVRSLDPSLIVSDFCKLLGTEDGSGGGKQGKGAYRLSLSPKIDPDEDEEDIQGTLEMLTKREIKRILRLVKQ